jgi:hypothetical protein
MPIQVKVRPRKERMEVNQEMIEAIQGMIENK